MDPGREARADLVRRIESCRACPRLVAWREEVASSKRASFRDETYWGRPVPGFGDPSARIAVVGLAPAAHGANRTGRIFTGDRSGDWLFASMHRVGLANQPLSLSRDDGLTLKGVWVTAAVRCAPPANKPLPEERDRCLPFLEAELALLDGLAVIVVLGQFAYDVVARMYSVRPRPRFGHGVETSTEGGPTIICSFHPSQQNTFTGKLTVPMTDAIFQRAAELDQSAGDLDVPELPEVENYRRLAESALERPIRSVLAPDAWYLKRGLSAGAVADALAGRRFVAARRRGKLLMLDTARSEGGPVLGLRFGMSGRLVVDGSVGVDRLLYSSAALDARFDRFTVSFDDGGSLVMSDPRRLGGVELDPDESRLGPDAVGISLSELKAALAGSSAPLKARLLDQAHIAGVGNLIADEILWRAGLSPLRPAGALSPAALRKLHTGLTQGLALLIERGGSHTGDLMAERRRGGHCPRDGAALARATVGGRTTFWCPRHQK